MNGGSEKAVAECKELRNCGLCPRECVAWHPHSSEKKQFCRRAMRAERRPTGRRS